MTEMVSPGLTSPGHCWGSGVVRFSCHGTHDYCLVTPSVFHIVILHPSVFHIVILHPSVWPYCYITPISYITINEDTYIEYVWLSKTIPHSTHLKSASRRTLVLVH